MLHPTGRPRSTQRVACTAGQIVLAEVLCILLPTILGSLHSPLIFWKFLLASGAAAQSSALRASLRMLQRRLPGHPRSCHEISSLRQVADLQQLIVPDHCMSVPAAPAALGRVGRRLLTVCTHHTDHKVQYCWAKYRCKHIQR